MTTPRRRAVYADLMRVPDHKVAEIVEGELVVSPRPASPHAYASSALGAALITAHRRPGDPARSGGWWILDEPELHLGADVLVPDLAAWRVERLPVLEDVPAFGWADWVCEVVSPGTERLDRDRKMPIYLRAGIAHAWLVDPRARTLEAYAAAGEAWMPIARHVGDVVASVPPFADAPLELARLWLPR